MKKFLHFVSNVIGGNFCAATVVYPIGVGWCFVTWEWDKLYERTLGIYFDAVVLLYCLEAGIFVMLAGIACIVHAFQGPEEDKPDEKEEDYLDAAACFKRYRDKESDKEFWKSVDRELVSKEVEVKND